MTFQKYGKIEGKNETLHVIPPPKITAISILVHTFKTYTYKDRYHFTEIESIQYYL